MQLPRAALCKVEKRVTSQLLSRSPIPRTEAVPLPRGRRHCRRSLGRRRRRSASGVHVGAGEGSDRLRQCELEAMGAQRHTRTERVQMHTTDARRRQCERAHGHTVRPQRSSAAYPLLRNDTPHGSVERAWRGSLTRTRTCGACRLRPGGAPIWGAHDGPADSVAGEDGCWVYPDSVRQGDAGCWQLHNEMVALACNIRHNQRREGEDQVSVWQQLTRLN